MNKNPAAKAFLIAVILSVVLPFIPILRWGLLPFDYLNTHLHELFHALAGILTGGTVDHIEVFATSAGVTYTRGGWNPIIQMSGYLGASLFGSFMVQSCHNEKKSQLWMRILGIMVLVSNVLFVRGDAVGWTVGLAWPVIILYLANKLKGEHLLFAAQFFAVQQCLNSIKSLRDLLLLANTDITTDAQLLARDTHVPAIAWAILWTIASVFGIILATLRIYRGTGTPKKVI